MAGIFQSANKAIINIANVTRRYPGVLALDDVCFSIQPGEVRALLGKNGAGKSTLIKMITGAEIPDTGIVEICGKPLKSAMEKRTKEAFDYGVRSVYQELSLVSHMSVAENMFLGSWLKKGFSIDEKKMYQDASRVLKSSNIPINPRQLAARLSPAECQLVEIARSIMNNPKIVILDEPTSSLANKEVNIVFDIIRKCASLDISVIYVSHRMNEIREIADAATIMRDGRIISTEEVKTTDTQKIVHMMLGDEHKKIKQVNITSNIKRVSPPILHINNISDDNKLKNIHFNLYKNEVLGIAGVLGSGRTELLKIIAGLNKASSGNVIYHQEDITALSYKKHIQKGIAITPENRKDDGIIPILGVDENIILADFSKVSKNTVLNFDKIRQEVHKIIDHINIKTSNMKTPIDNLSGGNQQKVVIGKWIYANIDVLLLDEPTRGVDVGAKQQIYTIIRKLANAGKNIIIVSSEIEELPHVCDRVLVLKNGAISQEFIAPNISADTLLAACLT